MAETKKANKSGTLRSDGRRPFLTYMDPELIKAVKRQALDTDVHAYELVEKFVAMGLKPHREKS